MADNTSGIPPGAAGRYERELRRELVEPVMRKWRASLRKLEETGWTSAGQVSRQLAADLESAVAQLESIAQHTASAHVLRLAKWHKRRTGVLFRKLGVDLSLLMESGVVKDALAERIADNVRLIKTIPPRMHDSLMKRLRHQAAISTRFDPEVTERVLRSVYGVTGYNLRRLTRDQTTKQLGQMTQIRQTQAGFTHYTWITANDDRVRDSHAENDGQVFEWGRPPPTGHPGHEIQCRCQAAPVVSDEDLDKAAGLFGGKPLVPPVSPSIGVGLHAAPRSVVHDASKLKLPRPGKLNKYAKRTRREMHAQQERWDHHQRQLAAIRERIARIERGQPRPGDISYAFTGDPAGQLRVLRKTLERETKYPLARRPAAATWTEHAAEEATALLAEAKNLAYGEWMELLRLLNDRPGTGFLRATATGIHAARGRELFGAAVKRLEGVVDRDLLDGIARYRLQGRKNVRAGYFAADHRIKFAPTDRVRTMVHEITHAFEYRHGSLSDAAKAFNRWRVRSGSRSTGRLWEQPNPHVKHSIAWHDERAARIRLEYSTKPYPRRSTEIVTIGLCMMTHPRLWRVLLEKDPDLFRFIYSNVVRFSGPRPVKDVAGLARRAKAAAGT